MPRWSARSTSRPATSHSTCRPRPTATRPSLTSSRWACIRSWVWRYDLAPAGPSETRVTLSYDWSAVPGSLRQHIGFPPFPPDHLGNSLAHLARLVTA